MVARAMLASVVGTLGSGSFSHAENTSVVPANAGLEYHKENLFGGKGQNTRIFTDGSFVEEYFYDFEQSRFQERRIPRTFSANIGIEHSFMIF